MKTIFYILGGASLACLTDNDIEFIFALLTMVFFFLAESIKD